MSAQTLVPIATFAETVADLVKISWKQPDWLSTGAAYQTPWPVTGATVAMLAENGQIALTTVSRASDLATSYGSLQTTIGTASFAINDDVFASSGRHVTVYGGYDQAQAQPGSQGLVFGREIDAVNLGGTAPATPTPGSPLSDGATGVPGTTASLWLASGGGLAGVSDASFALGIKDNGARYLTGILFGANALTNYSGFSYAMRLGKGHLIQWHDAADAPGPNIGSTISQAANAISLQFQDGGVVFANSTGNTVASVQQVVGAVNGITLMPSASGASVAVAAIGKDASINLALTPKGLGGVQLGGTGLGFYGASAAGKPTISGSRGGNAALASLIASLAELGLITDGTTP